MSDSCWLTITFMKGDKARILEMFGVERMSELSGDGDLWERWDINEAPYSLFDQRLKLSELGVHFYGHHAAGGEYTSHCFVSWKGVMTDVMCVDSEPVARMLPDRNMAQIDMSRCHRYYHDLRRVKEDMGISW